MTMLGCQWFTSEAGIIRTLYSGSVGKVSISYSKKI